MQIPQICGLIAKWWGRSAFMASTGLKKWLDFNLIYRPERQKNNKMGKWEKNQLFVYKFVLISSEFTLIQTFKLTANKNVIPFYRDLWFKVNVFKKK